MLTKLPFFNLGSPVNVEKGCKIALQIPVVVFVHIEAIFYQLQEIDLQHIQLLLPDPADFRIEFSSAYGVFMEF